MPPHDVVTAVIEHDTRAGIEADYEAWLQHITACAQRFPGHVGVNILRMFSRDETTHIPCGEAG